MSNYWPDPRLNSALYQNPWVQDLLRRLSTIPMTVPPVPPAPSIPAIQNFGQFLAQHLGPGFLGPPVQAGAPHGFGFGQAPRPTPTPMPPIRPSGFPGGQTMPPVQQPPKTGFTGFLGPPVTGGSTTVRGFGRM